MSAFSMAPIVPVPLPAADFPEGIQFQENGTNVGPPNPQFVSMNGDVEGTYDPDTGTVHYQLSGAASGGSSGAAATDAVGFRARRSGSNQTSGTVVVFQDDSTVLEGNWNSGNYNEATGIYTVPAEDDGYIHEFEANLNIENGDGEGSPAFVSVAIVKESGGSPSQPQQLGLAYTYPGTTGEGSDSFATLNSGKIQLREGDQVYVRRNGSSWSSTVRVTAGAATFFSGLRHGVGPVAPPPG